MDVHFTVYITITGSVARAPDESRDCGPFTLRFDSDLRSNRNSIPSTELNVEIESKRRTMWRGGVTGMLRDHYEENYTPQQHKLLLLTTRARRRVINEYKKCICKLCMGLSFCKEGERTTRQCKKCWLSNGYSQLVG